MNPQDPELEALIKAERSARGASQRDRERVRQKVKSALALGAGAAAGSAWAGKVVAAVALGALVGGAGYLVSRRGSSPASPLPAAVARVDPPLELPASAPTIDLKPVAPVAAPEATPPAAVRPKRHTGPRTPPEAPPVATPPPAPAPTPDPAESIELAAEVQGLREAYAALRSGRAEQALELLSAQDARFVKGQLQPERAGAQILAHCQLGRFAVGLEKLRAFEATYPGSSLLPRMRSACGVESPP